MVLVITTLKLPPQRLTTLLLSTSKLSSRRRRCINNHWYQYQYYSSSRHYLFSTTTTKTTNATTTTTKNPIPNKQNDNNNKKNSFHETDVLIVGGGPSGLFLANLLNTLSSASSTSSSSSSCIKNNEKKSNNIISYTVLEAQSTEQRFRHPQAHFLNTRTMEIFKHALPDVYQQIIHAMPPVDEWKYFQFGPTMTTTTNDNNNTTNNNNSNIMARVLHPVDRPLRALQDANGKLVHEQQQQFIKNNNDNNNFPNDQSSSPSSSLDMNVIELSDCSVGHLAQHVFCRILYDAAIKGCHDNNHNIHNLDNNHDTTVTTTNPQQQTTTTRKNQLLYGTRMEHCSYDETTKQWTVTTNTGQTFVTSIIIAADGAKSNIRNNVLQIPMLGQEEIQHLINVHFTLPKVDNDKNNNGDLTSRILPAMLYTIFSPKVLAMIVRHSQGEYVMQIPYFPPYQTLEDDFTIEKVSKMILAALMGQLEDGENKNDETSKLPFEIQSIRPWTMGSLVAQDYYSNGIFLVGDAAHVFPPAGGFGMNTGLQDVFTLVWRLVHATKTTMKHKDDQNDNSSTSTLNTEILDRIGILYQAERQPIARQNAALSVRNYKRVLGVMEACYLHHQHPAILIAGLNATKSFIPLEIRKKTFQSLLETALWPLGQLLSSSSNNKNNNNNTTKNPLANHLTQNLQKLLQSGQGLPLLFPNHEIGFQYTSTDDDIDKNDSIGDKRKTTKDDFMTDTMADLPKLVKGGLFPHLSAKLLSKNNNDNDNTWILDCFPNLCFIGNDCITTRDLAIQMRTTQCPFPFCLLYITHDQSSSSSSLSSNIQDDENYNNNFDLFLLDKLCNVLSDETGVPVKGAHLIVTKDDDDDDNSNYNAFQAKNKYPALEKHDNKKNNNNNDNILTLSVNEFQWNSIDLDGGIGASSSVPSSSSTSSTSSSSSKSSLFVIIRPDGHVASLVEYYEENEDHHHHDPADASSTTTSTLTNQLVLDIRRSLFPSPK